jgi:hypothetical protein
LRLGNLTRQQRPGVSQSFSTSTELGDRFPVHKDADPVTEVTHPHPKNHDQATITILKFNHTIWYAYYTKFLSQKEHELDK